MNNKNDKRKKESLWTSSSQGGAFVDIVKKAMVGSGAVPMICLLKSWYSRRIIVHVEKSRQRQVAETIRLCSVKKVSYSSSEQLNWEEKEKWTSFSI